MNDDRFDDFGLHDPRTREEIALDLLRAWLSRPNWCLGPGPNMVAGYSEAACLLAGIDPELTMGGQEDFGWKFLPGALPHYGLDENLRIPAGAVDLRNTIFHDLDRLSGLTQVGARPVREIISQALSAGFLIPWLAIAKSDPECAMRLPKEAYRVGAAEPPKDDYRQSARGNANKRWAQDDGRRLRNGIGRETFNMILEDDFEGVRFKTSGRINRNAIARQLLKAIEEFAGEGADEIPVFDTVRDDVGRWLAEVAAK